MENVWELQHDENYVPVEMEYIIRVEHGNKYKIYTKREGKINYHWRDFPNFMWHNMHDMFEGKFTIVYFEYETPLRQRIISTVTIDKPMISDII